jgi:O-antigen biosynthesis protein
MNLSVIIVNYNVKYFLEQCLYSVLKASGRIDTEIIVVDNNSADGSVQMIAEKFPQVKLIANSTNTGFARANNQAIRVTSGKYILLLNPDTVIQEDTLFKCAEYMDSHVEAGCLGVKMIDGRGNYLPESKRALPVPAVAFYKVFGLSALFPRSRSFGKYHLGHLDPDRIHAVDVISGAFMFIRRSALEKTGLLDEQFFMYGEDIDLSYRLTQAGYKNIYFPSTTIIHYKGESTRKGSINYVLVFYRAMIIFARKHFKHSTFRLYSLFIHLAIYIRAAVSLFSRFLSGVITPLLDASAAYAGYYFFLPAWERQHFDNAGSYPPEYLRIMVPAYLVIWIFCIFISTGYEKKVKLGDLVRGILTGTLIILVIYALLPENWRFSRALILLGTLWVLLTTILIRYLLHSLNKRVFSFEIFKKKKRIIIIGDKQESNRVYSIIRQTHVVPELIGYVSPGSERISSDFMGDLSQIEDIVRINQADELIFCSASVSSQQIIRTMLQFTDTGVEFKIAPPESLSVIGSNSNDIAGELYVLHFNTLSRLLNKRKKRLFDIMLSLLFLPACPIMLFSVRNKPGFIRNIFSVLTGITSWVGYYRSTGGEHPGLPKIRPGILTPADMSRVPYESDDDLTEQVNLSYAKDYRIRNDLRIIMNNIPLLGRRAMFDSENNHVSGK